MNSGVFAATFIASGAPVGPSLCIAAYGSFGRMYWFYHWAGDCIAGILLAFAASSCVDRFTGGFGQISWLQYGVGTLGFIAWMKVTSSKHATGV